MQMSLPTSFYWHDYETWGADPRRDRVAQFAGMRTDLDLNPIGEPLVIYAIPADDFLPQPEACMVTGLSPQFCRDHGMPESDFFAAINSEFSRPGTCVLGYNSIRFDDEFTRFGFYRNFIDPYAREWRDGNSRWDLIDIVRLTRALRPEGIEWPSREDGSPSFRLEQLTAANGIAHEGAHDALSDVRATIALARLIRDRQPKLFDYLLRHRDKRWLSEVLNVRRQQPVLHVSARYPARLGCIAAVLPLAMHPVNRNGVIVYDLRHDPEPLLSLSVEQIRERLYTPKEALAEHEARIALKTVHLNRSPVVVPMNTLTDAARAEWKMDEQDERRHRQQLLSASGLQEKLAEVFSESTFPPTKDPDQALYDGFIAADDRKRCDLVRRCKPEELADCVPGFDDPKLNELLFRYRARNYPHTLSATERERWQAYRVERMTRQEGDASISLTEYRRQLSRLAIDTSLSPERRSVVDALLDWPAEIGLDQV